MLRPDGLGFSSVSTSVGTGKSESGRFRAGRCGFCSEGIREGECAGSFSFDAVASSSVSEFSFCSS